MPNCAHCGFEVPENALVCPACGVDYTATKDDVKASPEPYFLGMFGILVGAGVSFFGMYAGLIDDPIGIFVPALGLIAGIRGVSVAYVQRNLEGNYLLRMMLCMAAVLLSAAFFAVYVLF